MGTTLPYVLSVCILRGIDLTIKRQEYAKDLHPHKIKCFFHDKRLDSQVDFLHLKIYRYKNRYVDHKNLKILRLVYL